MKKKKLQHTRQCRYCPYAEGNPPPEDECYDEIGSLDLAPANGRDDIFYIRQEPRYCREHPDKKYFCVGWLLNREDTEEWQAIADEYALYQLEVGMEQKPSLQDTFSAAESLSAFFSTGLGTGTLSD